MHRSKSGCPPVRWRPPPVDVRAVTISHRRIAIRVQLNCGSKTAFTVGSGCWTSSFRSFSDVVRKDFCLPKYNYDGQGANKSHPRLVDSRSDWVPVVRGPLASLLIFALPVYSFWVVRLFPLLFLLVLSFVV